MGFSFRWFRNQRTETDVATVTVFNHASSLSFQLGRSPIRTPRVSSSQCLFHTTVLCRVTYHPDRMSVHFVNPIRFYYGQVLSEIGLRLQFQDQQVHIDCVDQIQVKPKHETNKYTLKKLDIPHEHLFQRIVFNSYY